MPKIELSQRAKIRVGIIFGGRSAEHEISILSARNVLEALDRSRFEPVLIGIDKTGRWLAQDEQRLLEIAGIPYVGAGVLGSAIGMDKDVMKRLLRDANIPVAEFRTIRRDRFDADQRQLCGDLATLGFPLFTKPANAGSSVGIRKVTNNEALQAAMLHAFEFDDKVIAEAAVVGREIELAVLGGNPATVSVAGEVVVNHRDGFYSYDAKYLDEHGARLELPARISAGDLARAQSLALRAFDVLECEGMARVDLFLREDGEFLVNEINTIPGFTAISMYPKLWVLSGIPPTELVSRLIDLALHRGRRRAAIGRSFFQQ